MAKERERGNIGEADLFTHALLADSKDNYLGNTAVVQALLRVAVKRFSDKIQEGDPAAVLQDESQRIGRILLGKDKDFAPMETWNAPGAIDEFCAKWLGSSEADPEARMEHSMLKFFDEISDVADTAQTPGVLDEQWQWEMDAIIAKYTALFLGQSIPEQEAMDLK